MSVKDTTGKAKLRYLPYKSLEAVAKIREFGVSKYGDDTCWRDVPVMDFVEASARHVFKYMSGEINDNESGLNHLHHAACSLMLAIAIIEENNE